MQTIDEQKTTVDGCYLAPFIIGKDQKILHDCAIIVQDGIILDILPQSHCQTRYLGPITKFDTHVLLPGFVNAHTHAAMNYFRGIADDRMLKDWLEMHIWPRETKWLSDEFVYDATEMAIAEMILSGTTCFNDMYFFPDAIARAAIQAGIRSYVGMTVIDVKTAYAENAMTYMDKAHAFYATYKHHALVKPIWAPHAPFTVDYDMLAEIIKHAKDHSLKVNFHLHETEWEIEESRKQFGYTPLQCMAKRDLLSDAIIGIHLVHLDEEDRTLLASTGVNAVHCPASNMKLASGVCPVVDLQKRGVMVALGTDSAASNNDLNMLSEMRLASILAKVTTRDPTALSAKTALAMATSKGARTLGAEGFIGSLEVGKAADFIAIQLDDIATLPLYDPISQVVYAASRNQVSDVFVRGRAIMRNYELLTLDQEHIKRKARAWGARLSV